MAAAPIGSRSGDIPIVRDQGSSPVHRKTPLATVIIGIDAVVGGTAADFVETSRPRERPRTSPTPLSTDAQRPERPGTALVLRRKTGEVRAIQPFAQKLVDVVEPVRTRLLDEAARLDWVRQAALEYVDRPGGDREVGQ